MVQQPGSCSSHFGVNKELAMIRQLFVFHLLCTPLRYTPYVRAYALVSF